LGPATVFIVFFLGFFLFFVFWFFLGFLLFFFAHPRVSSEMIHERRRATTPVKRAGRGTVDRGGGGHEY
jgi:hypothetical protein